MFVSTVGSEGVASMLLAAVVVIRPLPGTALLSIATVFLLNALFSGQFGVVGIWMVLISVGCFEIGLWVFGVTRHAAAPAGSATCGTGTPGPATCRLAPRVAAAIGLANAATLLGQYCIVQEMYRLFFADWYVAAVVLITGLGYGAAGAALGTALGARLRRITL
ncbi:MAG: hypothetical protein R3C10_05870 [Pirellulales bacterium]